MNTPATATFKEFARILGVKSRSYIGELKRDGRLVLTEDGKAVLVPESLQRIQDTRDPSKAGVAARHQANREGQGGGAPPEASAPPSPPPAGAGDDWGDTTADRSFSEARARREHYQALQAKRDWEVSMGKLLEADKVVSVISTATVTLRTSLESLPDVLAPQLVGIPDEARARALLAEAIEHALDEAIRQFNTLAKAPA